MTGFRKLTTLATGLLAALALAAPAHAAQNVETFDVTTSTTDAGDHPNLVTTFSMENPSELEAPKDIILNFPEGLFGNPQAITNCRSVDFALSQCPVGSQAGIITLRADIGGNPNTVVGIAPIFDMESQIEGETARFAFIVPGFNIPISMPVSVRTTGDYGLRMTISSITQQVPLTYAETTLWGYPAEKANDDERFPIGSPGSPAGCAGVSEVTQPSGEPCIAAPRTAGIAIRPLIDNPTVCTGQPLPVTISIRTYKDPGTLTHASADYPATSACDEQIFDPVLNAKLTTTAADSPAGIDLQLRSPQFLGFSKSPSQLRSATLILPEGLSINPDAADGQTACSDDQANFDSEGPAECPDNSKIGNFDIRTPALIGPLEGSLYFGEPKPGNQYRVFMIASGFGINAKLVAEAYPDATTGQLTMQVTELPQVPFEEFNLRLFASQRGLIATPTQCRIYTADSLFVPWNDKLAPQRSRPPLSVSSGPNGRPCPGPVRPFSPRLEAGTSNPVAGSFSDFALKLDRDDGDQFLGDLNFRLPPGFTGSLRGIPYCPESAIEAAAQGSGRAELAASSCPAASQVGTTNVSAGPGTHPFNAVGKMFLSGPRGGAPLSLAAITPALAGPYDYGNVVVRVGLNIDPQTAQVRAVSERMPQVIGGVPIRMRSIRVNINRPNFTINPTNCNPMTVDSQGIGDQGTVTDFSSYFHVVNCANMQFKPKMAVKQVGRKGTKRSQNPRLVFDLRTRPGDANIKTMAVTLPSAFNIDQGNLGNICSEKELAEKQCAGRTSIGNASTKTPLLDQPLAGPVYAVSGSGGLPRLAFILNGQVDLVPRAESKATKSGLRTTVPVVPDAPIGHFSFNLNGGKNGYLANTRSLCGKPPVVRVEFEGQNGRKVSQKVKVKTACAKKRKARAK